MLVPDDGLRPHADERYVSADGRRSTSSYDELAAVLSHEVAHALAHHSSERLARERKAGRSFLSAFQDLAYNRAQESEADKIGVFLMTFAGYDPRAAVHFWEKMQRAKSGGGLPEILSTHPRSEKRAAELRKWVPRALAAKKAFDAGNVVRD